MLQERLDSNLNANQQTNNGSAKLLYPGIPRYLLPQLPRVSLFFHLVTMKSILIFSTLSLPSFVSADPSFHVVRRTSSNSFSSNPNLFLRQFDSCPIGRFACSDGGCCDLSTTCARDQGEQVCDSTVPCIAPPVPCGISCCDSGTTCVMDWSQFRCDSGGDSSSGNTSIALSDGASCLPILFLLLRVVVPSLSSRIRMTESARVGFLW